MEVLNKDHKTYMYKYLIAHSYQPQPSSNAMDYMYLHVRFSSIYISTTILHV